MKNISKTFLAAAVIALLGCPSDDGGGTGDATATGDDDGGTNMTSPSTTSPTTTTADTGTTTMMMTGGSSSTGPDPTIFDFTENAFGDFTPVDRMGQPAVNTAIHFGDDAAADTYNGEVPTDDLAGNSAAAATGLLNALHMDGDDLGLDNDLAAAGLDACVPPSLINDNCGNQIGPFIWADVLTIDTAVDATFPNGRHPGDPAVDIVLALLLIEIDEAQLGGTAGGGVEDVDALAVLGLSQGTGNAEGAFGDAFPYLVTAN